MVQTTLHDYNTPQAIRARLLAIDPAYINESRYRPNDWLLMKVAKIVLCVLCSYYYSSEAKLLLQKLKVSEVKQLPSELKVSEVQQLPQDLNASKVKQLTQELKVSEVQQLPPELKVSQQPSEDDSIFGTLFIDLLQENDLGGTTLQSISVDGPDIGLIEQVSGSAPIEDPSINDSNPPLSSEEDDDATDDSTSDGDQVVIGDDFFVPDPEVNEESLIVPAEKKSTQEFNIRNALVDGDLLDEEAFTQIGRLFPFHLVKEVIENDDDSYTLVFGSPIKGVLNEEHLGKVGEIIKERAIHDDKLHENLGGEGGLTSIMQSLGGCVATIFKSMIRWDRFAEGWEGVKETHWLLDERVTVRFGPIRDEMSIQNQGLRLGFHLSDIRKIVDALMGGVTGTAIKSALLFKGILSSNGLFSTKVALTVQQTFSINTLDWNRFQNNMRINIQIEDDKPIPFQVNEGQTSTTLFTSLLTEIQKNPDNFVTGAEVAVIGPAVQWTPISIP